MVNMSEILPGGYISQIIVGKELFILSGLNDSTYVAAFNISNCKMRYNVNSSYLEASTLQAVVISSSDVLYYYVSSLFGSFFGSFDSLSAKNVWNFTTNFIPNFPINMVLNDQQSKLLIVYSTPSKYFSFFFF